MEVKDVECRRGLRQGCPMSPMLFAIVLSELEECIHEGVQQYGFELKDYSEGARAWKIPGLFLADDIALFEGAVGGMQELTDMAGSFGEEKEWEFSMDKTKKMRFSGEGEMREIYIQGKQIDTAQEYEYLAG